jgi:hypothetical protein
MVKATLRSAVLLGIAAAGLVLASVPSFAEVQNVKVGGDVTVRAFHRENLDLNEEGCGAGACQTADTSGAGGTALETEDDFFQMTTGVNIGADLTENVSTFVRLVNERDWNQDGAATGDFDLSQAYITLKELFYSPLTLRVGTQPIVWGRGFIIGSSMLYNTLSGIGGSNDRHASITANEYTDFTAFDAVRGTLDLSGISASLPLTADLIYIKQDENATGDADDRNIWGVNLGTRMDSMNTEVETYFVMLRDKNGVAPNLDKDGTLYTIGVRGSLQPVEGASLYGELAHQFGEHTTPYDSSAVLTGESQQAWAVNLGGDVGIGEAGKVGGEWIYYTGHEAGGAAQMGWQPIAPSYFPTLLRSFQTASTGVGLYPNDQTGTTSAFTNQHELALYGSLKPIEDLTVAPRISWFFADQEITPVVSPAGTTIPKRKRFIGTEIDTWITYNYTDDVQLGLTHGVFFPGNVFKHASIATSGRSTAQQVVASVSVKF